MFGFVNQIFVSAMIFFGCNISSVNLLNAVSLSAVLLNAVPLKYVQERKIIPEIININSNEAFFYPYSVKVNKWCGSCNNINDSYSKLRVPDVVKNMNIKVFNLMSRMMKQGT